MPNHAKRILPILLLFIAASTTQAQKKNLAPAVKKVEFKLLNKENLFFDSGEIITKENLISNGDKVEVSPPLSEEDQEMQLKKQAADEQLINALAAAFINEEEEDDGSPPRKETFDSIESTEKYSPSKILKLDLYLEKIPDKLFEFKNLEELYLNSPIKVLPKAISQLKKLKKLVFRGGLSQFPNTLFDLTDLEILDLGVDNFVEIPNEISRLSKLNSLYFRGNKINEGIEKLKNLKKLDIYNNSQLPLFEGLEHIGALNSLIDLNISGNNINSLPLSFKKLTNLETFELDLPNLSEIPEIFSEMNYLKKINLRLLFKKESNNPLKLPSSMGGLKALKTLSIENYSITNTREALKNLTSLNDLSLTFCDLDEFPTAITSFSGLESLNLEGNKIKNIPIEINKNTNLTSFKISDNKLTSFPRIYNLAKLEQLNLSGNQIKRINLDSTKMESLVTLKINRNILQELPKLEKLANLYNFEANDNQISFIPNEFFKCKKLSNFYLDNNLLKELPIEIIGLVQLRSFSVKGNQLLKLPSLGKMTNLSEIDCSNNKLTSLPTDIGDLTSLESIDFSNNKLTALPSSLVKMEYLMKIHFENNEIDNLDLIDWYKVKWKSWRVDISLKGNPIKSIPKESYDFFRKHNFGNSEEIKKIIQSK